MSQICAGGHPQGIYEKWTAGGCVRRISVGKAELWVFDPHSKPKDRLQRDHVKSLIRSVVTVDGHLTRKVKRHQLSTEVLAKRVREMEKKREKTKRRKERLNLCSKATLRIIYYTPSYKVKICRTGSVNGCGSGRKKGRPEAM